MSRGRGQVLARFSAAVVALALLLAAEAVLVAVVHHDQVAGPWELRVALTHLVPLGLLLAVPIGWLGVVLAQLIELAHTRRAQSVLAALGALSGVAAGWGVTSGPHFRLFAVRALFVALLALGVGACAYWLSPRVRQAKLRFFGGFLLASATCIALFVLLNDRVLPRLYPAFHLGLSLLTVVLGAWLGEGLWRSISARALNAGALTLLVCCAGASPFVVRALPSWDNVRVLYVSRAPLLSNAVRVAARLGPAKSTTEADPSSASMPAAGEQTRWLNWKGRDIVLISIDALRADHMGTYGYSRPITPNIDALARQGVVFERAYCAEPHTSYSVVSLMTGKYIRPLLLQHTGQDSDSFAGLMRLYGFRTSAFYPPAIFLVDAERFEWAEKRGLDFEYRKVEYATAQYRVDQVLRYMSKVKPSRRVFMWVHFFEPHEPYEMHPEFNYGERDLDKYDSEIAYADAAVGRLVSSIRAQRPDTVFVLTADHGEAFGDHDSYYHGTTVYEEQARVPLIVQAKDLAAGRVSQPVQLIDLLPTVLHALDIPRTPRLRGNDLGPWLASKPAGEGLAFAESDDQTLLASGNWRLVCQRKIDACSLFDIAKDPRQTQDLSPQQPDRSTQMRLKLRELEASHGRYELAGARMEGKALPPALVRGIAGDADAAVDVAALLDDADVVIRRRAAEVLFNLKQPQTAASLSLALSRDEDETVRRWSALALTRLGQASPLASQLLLDGELNWRRHAALALAETGNADGEATLLDWWHEEGIGFERAKEIAAAFGKIRARSAVGALSSSLSDLRLRPYLALALADIGDSAARAPLLTYFAKERYENSRQALGQALVKLGASKEMAPALTRFLGVPDPLPDGVQLAVSAKITEWVGGPSERALAQLQRKGAESWELGVRLPKGGSRKGYRVLVRGRSHTDAEALVSITLPQQGAVGASDKAKEPSRVTLRFAPGPWREAFAFLPGSEKALPGQVLRLRVQGSPQLELQALLVVPLAEELPPPPPEPWKGTGSTDDEQLLDNGQP